MNITMSPQAAAVSSSSSSSTAAQSHRVSLVESDNCSFLSSLIEAADEAYQKTSDEFAPRPSSSAQVHAGPGRTTHAPGGGGGRPRFHLRKRKASVRAGAPCGGPSLSAVNSDFLSGLFADLEQQQRTAASSAASSSRHGAYDLDDEEHYVTDGESCPGSPVPSPKKRARLGRSLSRCTKSYASLSVLASATYSSTDSYVEGENFSDQQPTDMNILAAGEPAANHDEPAAAAPPTVSAATSTASASSAVAPDVLADSLSAAAALLADAIFPHLPATVSESPLRKSSSKTSASSEHSADLTAQLSSSTEAATEAGANAFHVEPEQGQEPEKELTLEEVFATATEGGPASSASAAVTPTDEDGLLGASGRGEDSYGWFLALDRDVDASEEHVTDAYHASAAALAAGHESSSSSCGSAALAFQAPVSAAAGCAAHDAEVEWAKAADTVDDVLGDLPF